MKRTSPSTLNQLASPLNQQAYASSVSTSLKAARACIPGVLMVRLAYLECSRQSPREVSIISQHMESKQKYQEVYLYFYILLVPMYGILLVVVGCRVPQGRGREAEALDLWYATRSHLSTSMIERKGAYALAPQKKANANGSDFANNSCLLFCCLLPFSCSLLSAILT
jgi:hypothetical protein